MRQAITDARKVEAASQTLRALASPDSPTGLLLAVFGSGPPSERVAALLQLKLRLDEQEQQLAFGLRVQGATWQHIADLWGLNSRQRAQQKFEAAALLDKLDDATGHTSAD